MIAIKLITIFSILGISYSENVAAPLLLWGNHKNIDKLQSNFGNFDSDDLLQSILKLVSEDENTRVLIGVEKTLSLPELIMKDGDENVLSNVREMVENSEHRKFFPEGIAIEDLISAANESILDIHNMASTSDIKNIRIVKFDSKEKDPVNRLKSSDKLMGEACKRHAVQYESYICVFTAFSANKGEHLRIARSLLATGDEETKVPKDPDNLYYLADLAMIYTKTSPIVKHNNVVYNLTRIGTVTPNGKILYVKFEGQDQKARFILGFNFTTNDIYATWSLYNILYEETETSDAIKLPLKPSIPITTSIGFSFHTPSNITFSNESDAVNVTLTFNSLQVEYFKGNHSKKFDVADDTVYFFTIPILSGLFVTTLLVTIVLLGLSMIFDIKTMDLFDDPKGKTVTINASE